MNKKGRRVGEALLSGLSVRVKGALEICPLKSPVSQIQVIAQPDCKGQV